MLLYCANGVGVATHDDSQVVAPSLYGAGAQVIPLPNGTALVPIGLRGPPWAIPTPTPALLLAYAAYKRWLTATAGTTVGTTPLLTDDLSQGKIAAVKQAFDTLAITTASFKNAAGVFVTVNAAQMTALYNGVVTHVQACYAAEATVAAAINGGTVTTYAGVDSAFAGIV
jgi:Domain of unknown function (DUF4376)